LNETDDGESQPMRREGANVGHSRGNPVKIARRHSSTLSGAPIPPPELVSATVTDI